MPLPTQALPTAGKVTQALSGVIRRETISVGLEIAAGTKAAYLPHKLPPRCKLVAASIINSLAVAVAGGGSYTADSVALLNIGTLAAIATDTVSAATVSAILTIDSGTTALAAGAEVTNFNPVATAPALNTSAAENTLVVVPMQVSSARLSPHTAATGMNFSAATKLDIRLVVDRLYLE